MMLVHITTVPETLGFLTGQVGYMERRGFEVHAVSSPGARLDRFCSREVVHAHPVEMTRSITPLRDLGALFRMWLVFWRIRPTIVHAHTPKGGLLGMMAATAAGVPVRVFQMHGLPHLTASGLRRRLLKWATGVACRLSHRVLCVSPSIRDVVISAGLSPSWKITVPAGGSVNGVDADGIFNPARLAPDSSHEVRARYGISGESVVMGFVGRLVRDKGVVELAGAWTLLRDEFPALEWLLVGDAEPHNPLPPHVLAQLLGDPRIHWTGWLDELPEIYGAMNLLVLPSYREGFPVVALEAAAMGLPVVTTHVPGCVDAVEDGVTGLLVAPRDPRALAEAIRNYLRHPERRIRDGQAGRQRALRDFQPTQIWRAVEGEYLNLLRKRGLVRPERPAADRHTKLEREYALRRALKQAIDTSVAAVSLALLSPVLLLVAIAIWLTMGRPVLFCQIRPGWRGEPFALVKFRTMLDIQDSSGNLLPDAERLTPLGKLLRRLSLDELPQLWNVLKGELSLVGPRPLLMEYLPRYSAFEYRRHEVKPGITGWAQVNGRNALTWGQKFALDVWYVDHWSLGLDLRILALTIRALWRRDGISQPGYATMTEFLGSCR